MVLSFFAKVFQRLFRRGLSESSELLNSSPAEDETITRFILSQAHFSRKGLRVKPRALEPWAQDNATSVFRIAALTDGEIWSLGQTYVANPRNGTIHARADLVVFAVLAVGLRVDAAEPPPRHASIVGWPTEKDAKMSLAQRLAAEAALVLKDSIG